MTLTAKGLATRQRIVDAAARLIQDNGAADTSLDDVRAATATSKSQLFHYFPDGRADLLLAVAEHEAAQVLAAQQPWLDDLTTAVSWEKWRGAVMRHYVELGDRCPLGVLTAELGKTSPETREVVSTLYDTWESALARGTQAMGIERPLEVARSILVAIQGGVVMLRATGRVAYLETGLDLALTPLRKPE
ncbi:TetR/AcrR family transcriptional regulator [Actinoplanes solisilvae]|uniref:TetR/AcrR family transcriptional regulator n=1 Tax=Actinoplanes solisilvae TaxID=2486853 RepID=UPI001F0C68E8|nr:TetR/AcrR family transcriptional regulator [Actinoplanes solisilvae]